MTGDVRGFSLIELMIVIVVTAILASIGLPSFQDMIASQRVKTAASKLQSALILTRSEALKRNANVSLSPVGGQWSGGWQVVNSADGSVLANYGAVSPITVTGPTAVVYQGSGRVSGTTAPSFKFSSSDTAAIRCVSVSLSGVPSATSSGC